MKGFTLMELLVVMAVILILSTVGMTSYTFSLKKSHDAQRKNDLATITKGLEAFANDFGGYPADDDAGKMVACGSAAALTACDWGDPMTATINSVDQTYLAKIPADPDSNKYYYYEVTTTGFNLYAALENTADAYYQADLVVDCGSVNCNYQVTESGAR